MNAQTISPEKGPHLMETPSTFISKQRIWTGYFPRALSVLFFVMDGGMKLFKPPFVVQATVQLGYPESAIVGIGVALFFCTVLYVVPRTAVLGAILLSVHERRGICQER